MNQTRLAAAASFLAVGLAFSSCKKEIEIQIREVEKQVSWSAVDSPFLNGLQQVILSTGSNGQAIYFQQPFFFTRFSGKKPGRNDFSAAAALPTDVRVRIAIGRGFFAYPDNDSLLVIARNDDPLNSKAYVQLRRLDSNAIRFNTRVFNLSKCTAINQNNYLLVPYDNNRPGHPITFLLLAVTPGSPWGVPPAVVAQRIEIPTPGIISSGAYVRNMDAIDDYFLVNLGDAGIYKIKQDGTFRQVHRYGLVDAFYKWNNTVYAPVEYNQILTSTDNGDSWQLSTGTPDHFTLANYYTVGDSLVGVFQNNLFSLRWNGPRFTSRFLKNDGLERAKITGLETLRDTVYVATTSGLFARPIKQFFETKK